MNEITTIGNTGKRMSSLEIAEMMEKQHKNVMRDIKSLIDQDAIGELSFELTYYMTAQNKQEPMYLLDFDATMTLITGYDAKRRSVVIRRWRELETGVAQPAYQLPQNKPVTLVQIDREFRAAVRMAKAAGLKGNQAVISANNLARRVSCNLQFAFQKIQEAILSTIPLAEDKIYQSSIVAHLVRRMPTQ